MNPEISIDGKNLPGETLIRVLFTAEDAMLEWPQASPRSRKIYEDLPPPPVEWLQQVTPLPRGQKMQISWALGQIFRAGIEKVDQVREMPVETLANIHPPKSPRLGQERARLLKKIFG